MNLVELEEYLKEKGVFTIAEVQQKFSYGYAIVRQAFKELEQAGKICLDNGVTFKWMSNPQPKPMEQKISVANEEDDDDEEEDSREAIIRQRRRELMERLARMSAEEDDDEDEEDDDDFDIDDLLEDDEEDDNEKELKRRRQELWDKLFADKKDEDNADTAMDDQEMQKSTKMIKGFNYGERKRIAKQVKEKLAVFFVNVEIRAIQIGQDRTRYVFDFLPSKYRISDLEGFESDIKACIKTDSKVEVIAPYSDDKHFAIDVAHSNGIDPLCKKALLFWLEKQDGRASIASIQRNLGIGFNRSGRIMDELQKLNCVDLLSPSESTSKPLFVKISKEDMEVLFPNYLGWTD